MKLNKIVASTLLVLVSLILSSCGGGMLSARPDGRGGMCVTFQPGVQRGGRPPMMQHPGHPGMGSKMRQYGGQHYRANAGTYLGEPVLGNIYNTPTLVKGHKKIKRSTGEVVEDKILSREVLETVVVPRDQVPGDVMNIINRDMEQMRSRTGQQIRPGSGPFPVGNPGGQFHMDGGYRPSPIPGGYGQPYGAAMPRRNSGYTHFAPAPPYGVHPGSMQAFMGNNPNRYPYRIYAPAPPVGARPRR